MRPQSIQHGAFLTLLVLVSLAFLVLVLDFLQPVFWAAVLAVLFYPMQERLRRAFGGRAGLAAAVSLVVILLVVILPLFAVGAAVAREAAVIYARLAAGEFDVAAVVAWAEDALPLVTGYAERVGVDLARVREGLAGAALTGSQYAASRALDLGQGTLTFAVLFGLMLYLLFFFLKDGDRLMAGLVRALPLGDERERRLFTKFADVSRATIKGTLVVGLVQGTIGGVLFWAIGLPAAVLWGVVMTLASLLPAVGPALVWVPAAIYLAVDGDLVRAGIVVAVGGVVIGLVDNVLRPVLVGRDTQMPDYLILLATLGGLALFGLSGVIIGPVIAALFLTVWDMFVEEYGSTDDPPRAVPVAALASNAPPPPTPTPPSADTPSAVAEAPAAAEAPASAPPAQKSPAAPRARGGERAAPGGGMG